MNVFLPTPDSEHFQSLVLKNADDWGHVQPIAEGRARPENWRPVEIGVFHNPTPASSDLPPSDFPYLSPLAVFSGHAVCALGDLLRANGWLLPLVSREGEYFLFVATTILDALDASKSKMWTLETGLVVRIEQYSFRANSVEKAMIFRLAQRPWGEIYVTDAFVERVRLAALSGFFFKKVWGQE